MALQGNIESFPVVDVLRLLENSSKSGRFSADGDRGRSSLWIRDGLVVGGHTARSGVATDTRSVGELFFDLLRSTSGTFVFDTDATAPESVLALGIESLIAQAQLEMAEWTDILRVVPSMRHDVSLKPELATPSVTLDARLWEAVLTVGLGAPVETIGTRLGLAELPTMRLVRDLVELGLVNLADADLTPAAPDGGIEVPAPGLVPELVPVAAHAMGPVRAESASEATPRPATDAAPSTDSPVVAPVSDSGSDRVSDRVSARANGPVSEAAPAPVPLFTKRTEAVRVESNPVDEGRVEFPRSGAVRARPATGEPRWADDIHDAEIVPPTQPEPVSAPVPEPVSAPVEEHATLDEILGRLDSFDSQEASAEELARQMTLLSPRAAQALASSGDHAADPASRGARLDEFPEFD